MEFLVAFALTLFALIVPSEGVEAGYVIVPCGVSQAGKITVREECGFLPVASIEGAQPVPDPYAGNPE